MYFIPMGMSSMEDLYFKTSEPNHIHPEIICSADVKRITDFIS